MRTAQLIALILALAAGTAWADTPRTGNHLNLDEYLAAKDAAVRGVPTGQLRGAMGDVIAYPLWITSLPFSTTGNTCQYNHDYDSVCPYEGSNSPDVVYAIWMYSATEISIDLCGSAYDTKVYVMDAAGNVIACNDDYYNDEVCGAYTSYLNCVALAESTTYYIIVDGYGGACGNYALYVEECIPCDVTCPEGAVLENELKCYDYYSIPDTWNGGCNSSPYVFEPIEPTCDGHVAICGWAGTAPGEQGFRDTDWYEITIAKPCTLSVCLTADYTVQLFVIPVQDCTNITFYWGNTAAPCEAACLTLPLAAGTYWVWAGTLDFYDVPCGPYVLTIDGYYPAGGASATEPTTWGTIKKNYR